MEKSIKIFFAFCAAAVFHLGPLKYYGFDSHSNFNAISFFFMLLFGATLILDGLSQILQSIKAKTKANFR